MDNSSLPNQNLKQIIKGIKSLEEKLNDLFLNNEIFVLNDRQISDMLSDIENKNYLDKTVEYKKYLDSIPLFKKETSAGKVSKLEFKIIKDTFPNVNYHYFFVPTEIDEELIDIVYTRTMEYIKKQLSNLNKLIQNKKESNRQAGGGTPEIVLADFDYTDSEKLKKLEYKIRDLYSYIMYNYDKFDKIENYYSIILAMFQLNEIILPIYDNIVDLKEENTKAVLEPNSDTANVCNKWIAKLQKVVMEPEKYLHIDNQLAKDIKLYLFGIFYTTELNTYLQQVISNEIVNKTYKSTGNAIDQISEYLENVEQYLSLELKNKFIKHIYYPKANEQRQVFIFTEKFKKTIIGLKSSDRKKITAIDKTNLYLIFEKLINIHDINFLKAEAQRFDTNYEGFKEILDVITKMYQNIEY